MIQGACHCGKVAWRFDGMPESATACSCTVCRRYGSLWAYDFDGERIHVEGPTRVYTRGDADLGFHFCDACGCIVYWRGIKPRGEDHSPLRPSHLIGATGTSPASASRAGEGRTRIAVNLRLAQDPKAVAAIPIRHFDGLESWKDLPSDGRTVGDMWF